MDGQILLFILAAIAAGVVLWLARSEDKEQEQVSPKKKSFSMKREDTDTNDENIQPLSKDEAREWLDDFLAKQQSDDGNQ